MTCVDVVAVKGFGHVHVYLLFVRNKGRVFFMTKQELSKTTFVQRWEVGTLFHSPTMWSEVIQYVLAVAFYNVCYVLLISNKLHKLRHGYDSFVFRFVIEVYVVFGILIEHLFQFRFVV